MTYIREGRKRYPKTNILQKNKVLNFVQQKNKKCLAILSLDDDKINFYCVCVKNGVFYRMIQQFFVTSVKLLTM